MSHSTEPCAVYLTHGRSVSAAAPCPDSLVAAGCTGLRIIAKNRSSEQLVDLIRWIRSRGTSRLEVILDLPGTKPRIGQLPGPEALAEGESILLVPSGRTHPARGGRAIAVEGLADDHLSLARPGHTVTVGDAALVLEVCENDDAGVHAIVLRGGELEEGRSVGFPCIDTTPTAMSDDDWRIIADVRLLELVDGLLVSFCDAPDVLRRIRSSTSAAVPIWAKIESVFSKELLRAVVAEADAVMIGRNDLTERARPSVAFAWQNCILKTCTELGRLCVVGTGVLESAGAPEFLSIAELTDFEHLVTNGATGFLVTGVAAKRAPVESVELITRMAARFRTRRQVGHMTTEGR